MDLLEPLSLLNMVTGKTLSLLPPPQHKKITLYGSTLLSIQLHIL